MSFHYPIYIKMSPTGDRGTTKGIGMKETGTIQIFVGSSKSNSHLLGEIDIVKIDNEDAIGFEMLINGQSIHCELEFENNNGRAGKLLD